MLEQQLTQELHRVGDHLDVPADLLPTKRIALAARPWWRRPAGIGVAAAAALVVCLGLTPVGQRTVLAATTTATAAVKRLLWADRVVAEMKTVPPWEARSPHAVPVGRTVETQVLGDDLQSRTWVTTQALTVADLKQQAPNYPLPAYLPPADADRVTIESFRESEEKLPFRMELSLAYEVPGQRFITLRVTQSTLTPVPAPGPKPPIQAVTVGGKPAEAFTNGVHWTLTWTAQAGVMELSSNLPLDELLDVAESIPDTTP